MHATYVALSDTVTCHLHFWQSDLDFLHATEGVERTLK